MKNLLSKKICKSSYRSKNSYTNKKAVLQKEMPKSCRSDFIQIYKEKGDVRSFGSYRSFKLLQHNMKVIEGLFEKQLINMVKPDEIHMRFMPGR